LGRRERSRLGTRRTCRDPRVLCRRAAARDADYLCLTAADAPASAGPHLRGRAGGSGDSRSTRPPAPGAGGPVRSAARGGVLRGAAIPGRRARSAPLVCCRSDYGQPAAKALRKQLKSRTLRTGCVELPSQFAYEKPMAKALRKQLKSRMFRTGDVMLPSQLG
jgi:hypothetical protein